MTRRAFPQVGLPARLALAVVLTAAADVMFFDRPVGISLLLFILLLALGAAAGNGLRSLLPQLSWLVLLAAILPLAENVSPLSALLAFAALAVFALSAGRRLKPGLVSAARQVWRFLGLAPFRLPHDLLLWRLAARRTGHRAGRQAGLAVWIMPLALSVVFVGLFGLANPIVEHWLSLLDIEALLRLLEPRRVIFWIPVLASVWAFLRPRLKSFHRRKRAIKPALPLPALPGTSAKMPSGLAGLLFGKAAILRALLLFNLLFAVQTVLDGAYLWGSAALPEGLTYAGYAHRGAYPLVATALLAAVFVLLAMRPRSSAAQDRRIRAMVYLWVAQNVGLVLSSILRLDLYVGVYALTYWRVAAFVWMGLVVAGLVLIVVRIAAGKGNGWLVGANLLTLSLALYVCCFVDWAKLIAEFNVEHSREMGGAGQSLDAWYLASLGPAALPAIDRFLSRTADTPGAVLMLRRERDLLGREHAERMADWRAWTFRGQRFSLYLGTYPVAPPPIGPGAR